MHQYLSRREILKSALCEKFNTAVCSNIEFRLFIVVRLELSNNRTIDSEEKEII